MPGIEIAGARIPSVTEILEATGLGPDFSGVPRGLLEFARLRGRALHRAIQWHEQGLLDEASIHPEIEPGFRAYLRFLAESRHVPLHSEKELIHPTWNYCGHIDRVGLVMEDPLEYSGDSETLLHHGRAAIFDWKYTESVDLVPAARQLAGYRLLWNANHPTRPAQKTFVVQLKRDATYRLHPVNAAPKEQVFLAGLVVFNERRAA